MDIEIDFWMLKWKLEKCVAICTNGAAAMTSWKSGVTAWIKSVNSRIIATHCMHHWQALASKDMEPDLHSVLNTAVTAVMGTVTMFVWTTLPVYGCWTMRCDGSLVVKFCSGCLSCAENWQSLWERKNPTLNSFVTVMMLFSFLPIISIGAISSLCYG